MASDSYADHAHGTHGHSHAKTYIIVWVVLLIATLLTWWTGRMDLGEWSLVVALAIAATKATLVILYFMHLIEAHGLNRLVVVISFVFVGVMVAFILGDFGTRYRPSNPEGSKWSDLPAPPMQPSRLPQALPREAGKSP
jgi:cytochrome c oxidase subunit 4